MDFNRRASDRSDTQPLSSPASPFDGVQTAYDSGDLGMQQSDAPYSPPMETPNSMTSLKSGSYMYLNTPTSNFEIDTPDMESLIGDNFRAHGQNHVKRFDHSEARRTLFLTGSAKLVVTLVFSALMCLALKLWEGIKHPIVLSKIEVRLFNAVMIGLSLCLGLNLLSSLKHYANTFRWSFLARRYVSLETFDLILHSSSLVKITKLMFISMPGIRGNNYLRKLPWLRDARADGTKWMWLVCLMWLSINIASQILVALLSLFWPVENSRMPLMTYGNVSVANMNVWYVESEPDTNWTSLERAWMFGQEAMLYPEFNINESIGDLSSLPGTPVYRDGNTWEYRFFNRDPEHEYVNYILSERKVQATTTCQQLQVDGGVIDWEPNYSEMGSMYIEGSVPGSDEWYPYLIPEVAGGSVSCIASVGEHCGPRCTSFTVLQERDNKTILDSGLWLCNSTLSDISRANGSVDISTHTDADEAAVYSNDAFARIATGAIGWTGVPWNWAGIGDAVQSRTYSPGSKWSPARAATTDDIEEMIGRFTIGTIAAFDDHGIRYNLMHQNTLPTQGQQLDVDWMWILIILGGICGMQLLALILLVIFANRTIVRDESFFSMAMLLNPVVARIGRAGMNLSGEEIKQHPKLKWKKIRYDYREGEGDGPNQVDIFFEGKDQREGRKSWAAGTYS